MPTAQSVKLVDELQKALEGDAKGLLEFHSAQMSDLKGLLEQVRNKDADDSARTDDMIERLDALKAEVVDQRKSSKDFAAKVTDWLEAQIAAVGQRMDADSGKRIAAPWHKEVTGNAKPVGQADGASVTAINSTDGSPAGGFPAEVQANGAAAH
jgi:hypothetical protein